MYVANAVYTTSYTMLTVTRCHSECCVLSGLDFEATSGSIVSYCLSDYLDNCLRALSRCKYDMGTLLWLNVENTQKSAHPLLRQTCKVLHQLALFLKTVLYEVILQTV